MLFALNKNASAVSNLIPLSLRLLFYVLFPSLSFRSYYTPVLHLNLTILIQRTQHKQFIKPYLIVVYMFIIMQDKKNSLTHQRNLSYADFLTHIFTLSVTHHINLVNIIFSCIVLTL